MARQEECWFDEETEREEKRMSIVEKFMTMEYGPCRREDPREALAWLDRSRPTLRDISLTERGRPPAAGTYFGHGGILPRAKKLATVGARNRRRMSIARWKAARAALPALARAHFTWRRPARYLYALARQVAENIRAGLAVSLKHWITASRYREEPRDIDISAGFARAIFYHHAGLGASCSSRNFRGYAACGVVGQIIPWRIFLCSCWRGRLAPRAWATGGIRLVTESPGGIYTP